MVLMHTPAVEENWQAIDFSLLGTDGKTYSLANSRGEKGLLIMFICNHCPYVKSIMDKIIRDAADLRQYGVNTIAIMSNDPEEYPEDSFENMQKIAKEKHFPFPYVIDKTQEVAKAYGAVCTPDFFGFNADLRLEYRGRLDESGTNNLPNAPRELFEAMKQVAETGKAPKNQIASMGCSIKWR